jgi:hypothetical protein
MSTLVGIALLVYMKLVCTPYLQQAYAPCIQGAEGAPPIPDAARPLRLDWVCPMQHLWDGAAATPGRHMTVVACEPFANRMGGSSAPAHACRLRRVYHTHTTP